MFKIGFGTDLHLLRPGTGLRLGGVDIPCEYGAVAHSDGDVLLHALIDALLGAAGLGDIGEHFPEHAITEDTDSVLLLEEAYRLVREAGVTLGNVDCVIDMEVVRLSKWKPAIRARVAALLAIPERMVNVKAKTAEGVGAVGEGRAMSAQVALLATMD